jgi:uncharacterized membrane protein (UPF0127 family)
MSKNHNKHKIEKKAENKTSKKNVFIQAGGIVILIVIIIYFFSSSGSNNKNNTSASKSKASVTNSVYKFTKNGELTFNTKNGDLITKIDIEIANTVAKREQGLMYRTHMAENHGMLFIFDKDQSLSFWMKNTVIPLDMIFINSKFVIVKIHKNAIPYDESQYSSEKPAKYVVEVNAGFADKYGIKEGDKITFRTD